MAYTDVDVTDTAALEAAIKGMGKLQGLAYCVGSIALKPLKATTTDDFIKVCTCPSAPSPPPAAAPDPDPINRYTPPIHPSRLSCSTPWARPPPSAPLCPG